VFINVALPFVVWPLNNENSGRPQPQSVKYDFSPQSFSLKICSRFIEVENKPTNFGGPSAESD